MATLAADVQSRYDEQTLRNLTNPQDADATGPDYDRIEIAATDVQADFKIICGVAYDATDERHVTTAVRGVVAKLKSWLGTSEEAAAAVSEYERLMEKLAMVTGRRRYKPITSSPLKETRENELSGPPTRPRFDRGNFLGTKPNPPR